MFVSFPITTYHLIVTPCEPDTHINAVMTILISLCSSWMLCLGLLFPVFSASLSVPQMKAAEWPGLGWQRLDVEAVNWVSPGGAVKVGGLVQTAYALQRFEGAA